MKLIFLLLLSASGFAQGEAVTINPDSIILGDHSINAVHKGRHQYKVRIDSLVSGKQNIEVSFDSLRIFVRSVTDTGVNWQIWASSDTVVFRHPPKHMIIGNNSYTSLYLNGNWVFLMDPTNLK